ncbi:MAG: hypothetical protein JO132_07935 [Streptosporangiaceae bacterium]|nr:hypothetical protein [Streptosporangiaceae bacterium]
MVVLAGYAAWSGYRHLFGPAPPPPGCQAGTGDQAVPLDTGQAGIAATIAGVAARHELPRRAVTVAYAAAMQESKLQDLDYGDRDSVGIFQQRPSQGWGTAAELTDPVYATTKFFAALVRVPGYATLPVDAAAQAVQHSADGSAYAQYAYLAALLADDFTGAAPHAVSCWYAPAAGRADLAGAVRGLAGTFGDQGRTAVLVRVTTGRSGQDNGGSVADVHAQPDAAWTVASWLVTHAQQYGISEVRYAGYVWHAADGSMGWQRADARRDGLADGTVVAG